MLSEAETRPSRQRLEASPAYARKGHGDRRQNEVARHQAPGGEHNRSARRREAAAPVARKRTARPARRTAIANSTSRPARACAAGPIPRRS
jgi:hypothetical protein